jgi:hypothetical protein
LCANYQKLDTSYLFWILDFVFWIRERLVKTIRGWDLQYFASSPEGEIPDFLKKSGI